ncbi:MAG: hypothetical protein V7637_2411 [Mycobacteriales bacterium]
MADTPTLLGRTATTARNLGLAALAATLVSTWLLTPGNAAGKDAFYGMVIEPQVEVDKAIPRLSDLGVHTVRLQMDVKDWGQPKVNTGAPAYDAALAQAGPLNHEGFQIILRINSEGGAMPSYVRARALFRWLLTRPGANVVDVFEIMGPVTENASDADAYSGALSLDQQAHRYVDGPLRAAAEVFHRAGKKVLGAAFTPMQQVASFDTRGTDTVAVTQAYLRAGYLGRVDYAGLEPTLGTPTAQVDWVRVVGKLFAPKKVWISQWELDRASYPDPAQYAAAMSRTVTPLHDLVSVVCYQSFTPGPNSYGVVLPAFSGYRAVQPAFNTYRGWPKR